MSLYRRLLFSVILFCALLHSCGPPEPTWTKIFKENSVADGICPNLNGVFALQGEALPGMPMYFQVVNNPLAVDTMLGLTLPYTERNLFSSVELNYQESLNLIFRGDQHAVTGNLPSSLEDKLICDRGKLTILKQRVVHGEGVTARMKIMESLSLAQDGSLVIEEEIFHRNRSFFIIPWTMHEEYGARFQRLDAK